MKNTRKHFIKSPFLAVCENYTPSLVDCLFYSFYAANFKCGLIALFETVKAFLNQKIKDIPTWILSIIFYVFFLLFYPLFIAVITLLTYATYATKYGIKRQKNKFTKYSKIQIRHMKINNRWGDCYEKP